MSLTLDDSQRPLNRYLIALIAAAALALPLLLWLQPSGPQVTWQSPPPDAAGVTTTTAVHLQFNQPISLTQTAVTLTPAVDGVLTGHDDRLTFIPDAPLLPNTSYEATLWRVDADGRHPQQTWTFHTTTPAILYLAPGAAGTQQLFQTTPEGDSPTQLSREEGEILMAAPAPDGARIALVVQREADAALVLLGSDGRQRQEALTCDTFTCDGVVWSPHGRQLLYERRDREAGQTGPPTLWWLDTVSGETSPLLAEESRGHSARFSADGQWLSFASPEDEGIRLYNFWNGRQTLIPNDIRTAAAWHPDENTLLVSDLNLTVFHGADDDDHAEHEHDFSLNTYLFKVDADDGEPIPISSGDIVDDGTPVWSPDGGWIVYGRTRPRANMGRQLWLMRADGSDPRPLTHSPMVNHGSPDWSPDGTAVLYQHYDLSAPQTPPSIHLIDVETGQITRIAPQGSQPMWRY